MFISVAQSIFTKNLLDNLAAAASSVNGETVLSTGATNLRNVVPATLVRNVVLAYNDALEQAFYVSVGLGSIAIIGALGVEWRSVKAKKAATAHT